MTYLEYDSSNDAGVDALVRISNVIASAIFYQDRLDLAFQNIAEVGIDTEKATQCMYGYPEAFYQGKISCQRLLDIVLYPFISLARRNSEEAGLPANSQSAERKSTRVIMESFYNIWASALIELGSWAFNEVQMNPSEFLVAKHAEFVNALLDAKIPEVGDGFATNLL